MIVKNTVAKNKMELELKILIVWLIIGLIIGFGIGYHNKEENVCYTFDGYSMFEVDCEDMWKDYRTQNRDLVHRLVVCERELEILQSQSRAHVEFIGYNTSVTEK